MYLIHSNLEESGNEFIIVFTQESVEEKFRKLLLKVFLKAY